MSLADNLTQKITLAFKPSHIELINESGQHSVPVGSESHFKLILVSDQFEGKSLLGRQRLINDLLQAELKNHIHALTMTLKTPSEWAAQQGSPDSPPCLGGSKFD